MSGTRRTWWRAAVLGVGGVALALVAVILPTAHGIAQGPAQTPIPPGVDFWQPRWMQRELWGPGQMPAGMRVRILRHWTYVQYGVPAAYSGAKSPLDHSAGVIAAGARIYAERCASCHGRDGLGDGDAASALTPSPALLAYMIQRPISVDEYLLWVVSDGGKALGSAMPGFKDVLSRDEIWKVIAYMRSGFGARSSDPAPAPTKK